MPTGSTLISELKAAMMLGGRAWTASLSCGVAVVLWVCKCAGVSGGQVLAAAGLSAAVAAPQDTRLCVFLQVLTRQLFGGTMQLVLLVLSNSCDSPRR